MSEVSASGVGATYIVVGDPYPLFADAAALDVPSETVTLTLSFANANATAVTDPDAAADGSSYAQGVYSVSGSAAEVTSALQGLQVSAAGGSTGFTAEFSDSAGSASFAGEIEETLGANYPGGGVVIWASSFPYSGVTLSDTGTLPDIVHSRDGELAWLTLDDAAVVIDTLAYVTLAGADDTATFHGADGWNSATGDDGTFVLDDAWLAVFGAGADVTFVGEGDQVSLHGDPGGAAAETVHGSRGLIVATDAALSLTGDSDLVYLDASDGALTLSAATPGAWSALYAAGGVVDLAGASLSVVGGGDTIDGVSGDDAVSLYQTDGVADTVNGSAMTITLNDAQAVVNGEGDFIWFEGGSGSTVTTDSVTTPDIIYGAGTIDVAAGVVDSVGGGALIDFLAPGGTAEISFTEGVWDHVEGAAGITHFRNALALVSGGGQILSFDGSNDFDNDSATLTGTNGDWDTVLDQASVSNLTIDSAQASIIGGSATVYLNGSTSAVSLYGYYGDVFGSGATIIANDSSAFTLTGGGDTVYDEPDSAERVDLAGTNGDWDTVNADDVSVSLQDAQASVFGGGNSVFLDSGGGSAASLYATSGNVDTIGGAGAFTLNNAQAQVSGGEPGAGFFYFSGDANTLDLNLGSSVLNFSGAFGLDSIGEFGADDSLQLSTGQFANYQAFQSALTQQGDDAVLTLDATDKVTFVGLQASSIAAAQVKFV